MPMTPKEMVKFLRKNGFISVSQEGSHQKFKNPITNRQTTVPIHRKELSKGLEQTILKQAGLKKQEMV